MLQGETPGFFCVCANLCSSWCRSAQTQVNLESVVCDYFVPVCQNRTTHVMNLLLCNLWHLLCGQLFIIKIGVFVNGYESFILFWHNSRTVDVRYSDPLQGTPLPLPGSLDCLYSLVLAFHLLWGLRFAASRSVRLQHANEVCRVLIPLGYWEQCEECGGIKSILTWLGTPGSPKCAGFTESF